MNADRNELVTLRVSVARIAQALDLLPTTSIPYVVLLETAKERNRGWNSLCARIVDAVEQLQNDLRRTQDELNKQHKATTHLE